MFSFFDAGFSQFHKGYRFHPGLLPRTMFRSPLLIKLYRFLFQKGINYLFWNMHKIVFAGWKCHISQNPNVLESNDSRTFGKEKGGGMKKKSNVYTGLFEDLYISSKPWVNFFCMALL